MLTLKQSFKLLNWKLLLTIALTLFIPVLYRTTRSFFIGGIAGTYNYSIAGNLQWINVLFEVLEEAFLLPLFFTLGKLIKQKDIKERNKRISWELYLIASIYLFAIIICLLLTKNMMSWLSVQQITSESITFVKTEFITRFFIMVGKIGLILLIAKNKWKHVIALLLLTTLLNIFLDLFIVSNNPSSLHKGILWIGYNQLISNSIIAIFYLVFIYITFEYKMNHLVPQVFFDREDLKQHLFTGAESFVRNAFFIFFVIKTINRLDSGYNQGDFWVANTFLWGWLLLPIMTISKYINREESLSEKETSLKLRLLAPFTLVGLSIIIWLTTIPTYEPFIRNVMGNKNAKLISHLVLISLGFYILMALNDPIDKVFLGNGKAGYILIQSLIVNVVVYIPYYFLKTHLTIDDVAIMMGLSMGLDSVITMIMFGIWVKKIPVRK